MGALGVLDLGSFYSIINHSSQACIHETTVAFPQANQGSRCPRLGTDPFLKICIFLRGYRGEVYLLIVLLPRWGQKCSGEELTSGCDQS